jgi:hypothetical protein
MPCKKLQDSASVVWKLVDVALDPAEEWMYLLGSGQFYQLHTHAPITLCPLFPHSELSSTNRVIIAHAIDIFLQNSGWGEDVLFV